MKKMYKILFIFAFATSLFSSCSTENSSDDLSYSIIYEKNEIYSFSNLPDIAKSGELIFFDVESTSVFYEIDNVYSNQVDITQDSFGYKFVMPKHDVTISVNTKHVGEYNNDSDNLDWASSVNGVISCASFEDKNVSWDVTQELGLFFPNISSSNYITSVKATIYSSNQNVIPDGAIEFRPTKSSNSNIIVGGKLIIDLKQINVGETYIYVNLKPNNSSLGTLIKKFNVVEYGNVKLDSFNAILSFENKSSYDMADLYINIMDMQYIYGSSQNNLQTIYLKDIIDNSYSFEYYVGHTYSISCGILNGTGQSLPIYDWIGSGNSSTGFNQFVNGILSLYTPNVIVDIVIYD